MEPIDFTPESVAPTRRRMEQVMGYRGEIRPKGEVLKAFDEALEIAKPLISPKGIYRLLPISLEGKKKIRLGEGGGAVVECPRIAAYMKRLGEAALFLATVGPRIEEEAERQQAAGRHLYALLLDAYGSQAAENTVDAMQAAIDEKLSGRGLVTTARYSPGYCDWPLEDQKVLFSFLDAEGLGVELTDHCIMLPRKSVSALAGVGKPGEVGERRLPCESCAQEDCLGRRAPFKKRNSS